MVTKKAKGEWEAETLAEWVQSETSTWKAQKSTSPDGKVFVGVRQYVKTAKYEGPGKGGITFLLDVDASDSVREVRALFEAVQKALTTPSKSKAKAKASPVSEAEQFLLQKNNGKYLTSVSQDTGVKVSSDLGKAQLFTKARAKTLLDNTLSDAWSMYAHVE